MEAMHRAERCKQREDGLGSVEREGVCAEGLSRQQLLPIWGAWGGEGGDSVVT